MKKEKIDIQKESCLRYATEYRETTEFEFAGGETVEAHQRSNTKAEIREAERMASPSNYRFLVNQNKTEEMAIESEPSEYDMAYILTVWGLGGKITKNDESHKIGKEGWGFDQPVTYENLVYGTLEQIRDSLVRTQMELNQLSDGEKKTLDTPSD